MEIRQVGGVRLDNLARVLRHLDKPLAKQVYAGLNRSVKPLTAEVKAEAARTLPHAGGYAAVMSRAVRIRVNRRGAAAVRLVISGKGRREDRDVPRVNAGVLRHPVYGRSRRRLWTRSTPRKRIPGGQLIPNPWAVTAVTAGFVDRPVRDGAPRVRRELIEAVDRVARTIP